MQAEKEPTLEELEAAELEECLKWKTYTAE
jgi:hypothetical protein